MDNTSTPVIYQFIHLGNNNKVDLIDINYLYKKEDWLISKFTEFENNLTEIPDSLIDKILIEAKIC